jgi:hypothetical protein
MSTTTTPDRFAVLPDEQTLAAAIVALEEHGSVGKILEIRQVAGF